MKSAFFLMLTLRRNIGSQFSVVVGPVSLGLSTRRSFTSTPSPLQNLNQNRILNSLRTQTQFHTQLQSAGATNTLLLLLFTTSACTSCRTITPLLTNLIESRPSQPLDRYSSIAFTELELDSPDTSDGNMMDLGVEWGVTSLPTLIGFGGRRAQRVTERITDTGLLTNKEKMGEWIDEQMSRGDPYPSDDSRDGSGGGQGKGLFGRLFG